MKAVTHQLACASIRSRTLIGRTARLTLAALLVTAGGLVPVDGQALPAAGEASPSEAVTSLRSEVRLRKLHLVRPDLIQYPLAYEVIC